MNIGEPRPLNALSVDVEDWFQVGAFDTTVARGDWETLPTRVERNSDAVLALFEEAEVKATFFTLGWVAERFPALMRRIAHAGHEIASHGYDHQRVFTMDERLFREDLRRTREAIGEACGHRVTAYRAPSFSIDARTPWAHPVLAEEGYTYSSSIAPVKHDHYGWPEAPRFAFRPLPDSALLELPVTTVEVGGRRFAAGGGGFFRLLPYQLSSWAISSVNGREKRPAIFYFHPWEIDPDQPRLGHAPLRSRLRHYTNLHRMRGKLARLLAAHRWGTTAEVAAYEQARLA